MIIDAHVHVFAKGSPAANLLGYSNETDDLLKEMDRAKIDAAVVLGLPEVQTAEEILEICAKEPTRLFPLLGVSPNEPAPLSSISDAKSMGFHGLKLHPRLNGYSSDDERLDPILKAAKQQGLPVLIDTIVPTDRQPLENLDWRALDRLAKRNAETTLVLAHACPPYVLNGFMVAKANRNVYLDISSTVLYYAQSSVEADLRFLSANLDWFLIYGSDYPDFPMKSYLDGYRKLIEGVEGVDLVRVFAENAIKVYGLPL